MHDSIDDDVENDELDKEEAVPRDMLGD